MQTAIRIILFSLSISESVHYVLPSASNDTPQVQVHFLIEIAYQDLNPRIDKIEIIPNGFLTSFCFKNHVSALLNVNIFWFQIINRINTCNSVIIKINTFPTIRQSTVVLNRPAKSYSYSPKMAPAVWMAAEKGAAANRMSQRPLTPDTYLNICDWSLRTRYTPVPS